MHNKVILIGHLGADPKITVSGENTFASFNLATSENWKDKTTGEPKSKTEWHRIEVKNTGLAKVVADYTKKGSKIYVEGMNRTREWDDNGVKKRAQVVSVENFRGAIVLLDKAGRSDPPEPSMDDMEREVGPLDEEIPL